MQAMDVHCCLIVAVWSHARATASVIELEFAAAQYAAVKKAAQMLQTIDIMFQIFNYCHYNL
jgi:hypothetical protein